MALVAHGNSACASLHQEKLAKYARYYAGQGQDRQSLRPFLYAAPRMQSACGSLKAKKVLGLVAQFESRSMEEEDARGGSNKAQRTLGLVTKFPRVTAPSRKSQSSGHKGTLEQRLAQAEKEVRRVSKRQSLAVEHHEEEGAVADHERSDDEEGRKREQHELGHHQRDEEKDDDDDEASQPDPEKRSFLDISLSQSPQQLSFPKTPIELDAGPDHELLVPPPRSRIRPHSYTAPRFSDRPTNKIASSRCRNLRAYSSPPNFPQPTSGTAPTPVPGEDMERDPLHIRFQDIDADPRSPMSPIGGTFVSNEIKAALEKLELGMSSSRANAHTPLPTSPPPPAQRRSRPRWSSLPLALMKLAKKRASRCEDEGVHGERKEVVTLTEENLQRWEDEVGYVPRMYRLGYDAHGSPAAADMHGERAPPVPIPAPRKPASPSPLARANAAGQMLTPPLSMSMSMSMSMSPPTSPPPPAGRSSSNGSTLGRMASPSLHCSTPTPTQGAFTAAPSESLAHRSSTTSTLIRRFPAAPSFHPAAAAAAAQPSLAAQKEALSRTRTPTQLITCALCHEVEHPSAFPAQPLSAACAHAPRTCKECVQHWVERCVREGGWARVACPECGVGVGVRDGERVRCFEAKV